MIIINNNHNVPTLLTSEKLRGIRHSLSYPENISWWTRVCHAATLPFFLGGGKQLIRQVDSFNKPTRSFTKQRSEREAALIMRRAFRICSACPKKNTLGRGIAEKDGQRVGGRTVVVLIPLQAAFSSQLHSVRLNDHFGADVAADERPFNCLFFPPSSSRAPVLNSWVCSVDFKTNQSVCIYDVRPIWFVPRVPSPSLPVLMRPFPIVRSPDRIVSSPLRRD